MSGDNDYTMGDLAAPDRYEPDPYAIGNPMGEVYPPQGGNAVRNFGRATVEAVKGIPGALVDYAKTPGALMTPNPYKAGSEEWYDFERRKADSETEFGAGTALNAIGTGGIVGVPARAGETVLAAGAGRRLPPREIVTEPNPRAAIGGNMPPEELRMLPDEIGAVPPPESPSMGSLAAPDTVALPDVTVTAPQERSWAQGLPRAQPAARSTEIPNIRGLPVEEAIDQARTQPHLIKSGDQSEGFYVGGPRDLRSKAGLNKIRSDFDAYIAADPRGGDWYDRYRQGVTDVTGGNPLQNEWMSKQHGQWSAGVDPGSEVHFVLKENNSALAGMPARANYPAQHEAHMRAIAANDPNLYQLGDKTAEYAAQVTPDRPGPAGATGVNDFRHARNFRYTETSGEPQKGALGDAGHRFLDYETALAVDRANRSNLGGRSDWTGEKLQAAPWVRQKALDIQARGGKNEDGSPKISYQEAIVRANRTIVDYFDRHTFYATHEAQPGADVPGHMMGSVTAGAAERDAFALDPRSNWATAPGGRDAIYSGLGLGDTGVNMRVRPSLPMRGMYTRPDGTTEFNMGQVARPLGTFDTPRVYDKEFVGPRESEPFKVTTAHDRAILNAGESVRALTDAQNAGAWHKFWTGGPAKDSTSLRFPRDTPATPTEMLALRGAAGKYGMGDIVDTGSGITATKFYEGPPPGGKDFDKAFKSGEFGQFGEPQRVRVGPGDAGYVDYVPEWQQPGSGAATRKMLEAVNVTPQMRAAFNNNADIGERALARMERDKDWADRWGAPREDIQNLRKLMGTGKGWIDRVDAALAAKAILPATALAVFAAASAQQEGSHAVQ